MSAYGAISRVHLGKIERHYNMRRLCREELPFIFIGNKRKNTIKNLLQ
jgi:hypothetical protein